MLTSLWHFGLVTCLTVSFGAHAYNADCNPAKLKEINEKYTATLLCSSLEPENFRPCITAVAGAGVTAFLAGALVGAEGTSRVGVTAAVADMSQIRRYFSPDVRKFIDQAKARNLSVQDTRLLIAELKKHPRLYANQIANLSSGLKLKTLGGYLKKLGVLSVVLAYFEATVFTPPEDCKLLNFDGIQRDDKKWVEFGMNCSQHINTDFFTQSAEEQALITQRSPALCKAVTSFGDDLGKLFDRFKTSSPLPAPAPPAEAPRTAE